MQLNKIMYIDPADPLPKSYAPKKRVRKWIDQHSTYSTMRYNNKDWTVCIVTSCCLLLNIQSGTVKIRPSAWSRRVFCCWTFRVGQLSWTVCMVTSCCLLLNIQSGTVKLNRLHGHVVFFAVEHSEWDS